MKHSGNYRPSIKHYLWVIVLGTSLLHCNPPKERLAGTDMERRSTDLTFSSSNKELVKAFDWARLKALSYAHDGTDPVGYWYEAALPNREAFCMRDVSHQAVGAEILGLSKHNYNMMLKFAKNISKEKDYCSYWEINRYNQPAPVDYETDKDFWYNLPANFDVIYNAYRLYQWTGNRAYIDHPDFKNFYKLSLDQYVDHWDLSYGEVTNRNRSMHLSEAGQSRFGKNRGIPTYNEAGRAETILGIDMTASLIAAYTAYSQMLRQSGESTKADAYAEKAQREQRFLDEFWWDEEKQTYRSIWYQDETFDYFMVGDNQAFLHYLYYFDVISDQMKRKRLVEDYLQNYDKLIVELKSYLPIMFYETGHTKIANEMIIGLCSSGNQRRDYPENSFTIIEHLTLGLMGINVDAASNTLSTLSRLEDNKAWAEIMNIPLLAAKVSVKHVGSNKTIVNHQSGPGIIWRAQMPGTHDFLYINGEKARCAQDVDHGQQVSWCTVELKKGDKAVVSTNP